MADLNGEGKLDVLVASECIRPALCLNDGFVEILPFTPGNLKSRLGGADGFSSVDFRIVFRPPLHKLNVELVLSTLADLT